MSSGLCVAMGCRRIAKWSPEVSIYPSGVNKRLAEPATMVIDTFALCTSCRDKFRIEDIFTEDAQNYIKTAFYEAGKANPDLDDVYVDWLRVERPRRH